MAYRLTVRYGQPEDPRAFDEHYSTVHVPLAAQIPHLTGFVAGRIETIDGSTPEGYLQAQLVFDSKSEALEALSSPQGQAAAADMANFATGGASVFLVVDDFDLVPEAVDATQ